jgi:hypothetical protein
MIADRAALPLGIKDRGVAIRGNHQNLLVCQHAGGSFYESAQTVLQPNRIGEETSKKRGFSGCSGKSRTGRLATPPLTAPGFVVILGNGICSFAIDRVAARRNEKGLVQWRDQLLRDQ